MELQIKQSLAQYIALLSYLEWKKTFPKLLLFKRHILIWLSGKRANLCVFVNCQQFRNGINKCRLTFRSRDKKNIYIIPETLLYIWSRPCRRQATSINPVVTKQGTVTLQAFTVDGFRNMTLPCLARVYGYSECFTSALSLPLGCRQQVSYKFDSILQAKFLPLRL